MGKQATEKPVIGVDLGGTKVLAGVVAANGKVLGVAKRATKPEAGVNGVVDRIAKTVNDAAKDAGVPLDEVAAVCSGAPGVLNPDTGVVRYAPNMAGWEEVPFARLLSERLGGLPVYIENDVNLGTLGEHALGAGKGFDDVVGIFVGTGIGGGLVIGALSGVVCFFAVAYLKSILGYDDALDAFGVHAVGGIIGAILTGVFVDPAKGGVGVYNNWVELVPGYSSGQILIQIKAVLVAIVLSTVVTAVTLLALKFTIGIRVSEEAESEGLDLAEHGEKAYNP